MAGEDGRGRVNSPIERLRRGWFLRQAKRWPMGLAVFVIILLVVWRTCPDGAFYIAWLFKSETSEVVYDYGVIIAGAIGLCIARWRGVIADRESKTAAETLDVDKTRLATDRFVKAVELLGARQSNNWPALEQRLGAIYALERLAKEEPSLYDQVMELLCAYVRANARAEECRDWPGAVMDRHSDLSFAKLEALPELGDAIEGYNFTLQDLRRDRKNCLVTWIKAQPAPKPDIRACLEVIARRTEHQYATEDAAPATLHLGAVEPQRYRLDLSHTNLRRLQLPSKARLAGVNFTGSRLEGVRWYEADLANANLINAHLQGAYIQKSTLDRALGFSASFEGADLQGASCIRMQAPEGSFRDAKLRYAIFDHANLESRVFDGADLRIVRLFDTKFFGASFKNSNFHGSALRKVYFRHEEGHEVLRDVLPFADGSLLINPDFERPPAWTDDKLTDTEFWHRWLRAQESGPRKHALKYWTDVIPPAAREGLSNLASA